MDINSCVTQRWRTVSFTWHIVDSVSTVNAPEVLCFWGNWLPGNEDRRRACVMPSYVSWSDERNWKKKKFSRLHKRSSGTRHRSHAVHPDDKFTVHCVMIGQKYWLASSDVILVDNVVVLQHTVLACLYKNAGANWPSPLRCERVHFHRVVGPCLKVLELVI